VVDAGRWAAGADPKLASARLKLELRVSAQMERALQSCKTTLERALCREAYSKMLHSLEDVLLQQHGYPGHKWKMMR
jgi:hypothetical protein